MDQKLNGANPLSYRGVNAYSPPDFVVHPRPPTTKDWRNFIIGTIWLDANNNPPDNQDIYMLVSIKHQILAPGTPPVPMAIWVAVGTNVGPQTLTGDAGGPVSPDVGLNINLFSGIPALEFNGNPGINTIQLDTVSGHNLMESLSDDVGAKSYADALGDIAIKGTVDRISSTSDGVNTITLDLSGDIPSIFVEDIGTAVAVTGSLNVIGGTLISTIGAGDTITISSAAAETYTTDDLNTAIPVANNINIVGSNGITTTSIGDTVTIDGSGAAAQMTFNEDGATTAVSLANNINFAGGTGITTTGDSAQTVTIDLDTPVVVANGGTGNTTFTAYSVICGGTAATNPFQNVVGLGTSAQVLTSQGAGALPQWEDIIAEKGTWIPVLSFSGGTVGVVYNTQIGVYEAFDNLVYIECGVVVTSVGASAGTCTITGLPFACSVSHPINAVAITTDAITYDIGYTVPTASVIPGTSIVQLPQCGSGKPYSGSALTAASWTTGIQGFCAISFALTYFRS